MDENKEQAAVDYLKKQIDMGEPETVLAVYQQVIDQNVFHTRIGYDFLQELKDFLYANPNISNERIPDFAPPKNEKTKKKAVLQAEKNNKPSAKKDSKNKSGSPKRVFQKNNPKEQIKTKNTVAKGSRQKNKVLVFSVFLNIVFLAMIIVMFVLTITSDSPNIINYKEKIENEYAQWEEDLTKREQELKKREAVLGETGQSTKALTDGTQMDEQDTADGNDVMMQEGQYADEEYEIIE